MKDSEAGMSVNENAGNITAGIKPEEDYEQSGNGYTEETKTVSLDALFEHIHNKVIHFPIALSIVGFLLMLIGYKDNKYNAALKIIIPFAALVAVVAVIAGLSQAAAFEGTGVYSIVETHRLLGIITLIFLILWSVALYVKKLNKFVWILAILSVFWVLLAGFYGGIISH